jgi:hypothetical protein
VTRVIACDQFAILGESCPECGGWLSATIPGGIRTGHGIVVCSEECATWLEVYRAHVMRDQHLESRDLLCACEHTCAPLGYPTKVHRDKATLWAARKGVPWEAAEYDRLAKERGW